MTRLALAVGKIDHDEKRYQFSEWPAVKPTTPWGSLPTLTLPNGYVLAQSRAVFRYVAKLAGLYPSDPILAAKCDEITDQVEDFVFKTINNCGKGMEQKEKDAERKKCVSTGKGAEELKKLDAYIKANGENGHCVGNKLSAADLAIYGTLLFAVCGFFDGIPVDCLDKYENIQAVLKSVGSNEAVVKHYTNEKSSQGMFNVYKKTSLGK